MKNAQHHSSLLINGTNVIKVQCFPLYSILLAAERTELDYFSLDVAGHDLEILKTLPWHIVGVKVNSKKLYVAMLTLVNLEHRCFGRNRQDVGPSR